MSLLDGGIAATFSAALSGIYLDATLHRRSSDADDGAGGGANLPFADGEPIKAQLDRVVERVVDGVPDRFQRILVLAQGVAEPTADDEITVRGQRWAIAECEQDPAQSHFILLGRTARAS